MYTEVVIAVKFVYAVGQEIQENIERAKANRSQCVRLGQRIMVITNTVRDLVSRIPPEVLQPVPAGPAELGRQSTFTQFKQHIPFVGRTVKSPMNIPQNLWQSVPSTGERPERQAETAAQSRAGAAGASAPTESAPPRAGSVVPNNTQCFVDGLLALKATLDDALVIVQKFADRKWFQRVVGSLRHEAVFTDIYTRLEQNIAQLNLGINVQELLNRRQDTADTRSDAADILARQAEIIQLTLEAKNRIQKLAMNDEQRHDVETQQLESLNVLFDALAAGKAQQKPAISKSLLIPFHELDIDELLAEGSFGRVYYGRWHEQEVAIKQLEGQLTPAQEHEFVREVRIMSQLRCKYIVELFAVCFEPSRACIVMEYMGKDSLFTYLEKAPSINWQEKTQLALEIALGLSYLHSQDVLHRDLKSANVLLDEYGHAKLSDFGLSKTLSSCVETAATQSQALQWMPPERTRRNTVYTEQSDIYSYGVLLWEIATGMKPLAGLSIKETITQITSGKREPIPSSVPAAWTSLIQRCWSTDPNSRPELTEIIQTLTDHTPVNRTSATRSILLAADSPILCPADSSVSADDLYQRAIGADKMQNYTQAYQYYQQATTMGHMRARTTLGMYYLLGRGVPADKQKAHDLLLQSAHEGHQRAMVNLAQQLELGDGVSQDKQLAQYWRERAATPANVHPK
jgi:Protein tyrosine and serine/threonine kinase/Sel1 repeat